MRFFSLNNNLPIIERDSLCPFLTSTPDIKPDDFISQYLELVSWSQPLHRLILFFELVVSVVNLQLVDVGGATEYLHLTLPGQYIVLFLMVFQMSRLCLLTGLRAALLTGRRGGGLGGWSKLIRIDQAVYHNYETLITEEGRGGADLTK